MRFFIDQCGRGVADHGLGGHVVGVLGQRPFATQPFVFTPMPPAEPPPIPYEITDKTKFGDACGFIGGTVKTQDASWGSFSQCCLGGGCGRQVRFDKNGKRIAL